MKNDWLLNECVLKTKVNDQHEKYVRWFGYIMNEYKSQNKYIRKSAWL